MSTPRKFRHLIDEKYSMYKSVPVLKAQEYRYDRNKTMTAYRGMAYRKFENYDKLMEGKDSLFLGSSLN